MIFCKKRIYGHKEKSTVPIEIAVNDQGRIYFRNPGRNNITAPF